MAIESFGPAPAPAAQSTQGPPDLNTLVVMLGQFKQATQMLTPEITKVTLASYGAVPALTALSGSVALFTGQAVAANTALLPLNAAITQTQTAAAGLDTTLRQMEGLNLVNDALLSLDAEAISVQETLDNFLTPALVDAQSGMGYLGTAADGFASTAHEVLTRVARASRIAMNELASIVSLQRATITVTGGGGGVGFFPGAAGAAAAPAAPAAAQESRLYNLYERLLAIAGAMGSAADIYETFAGSGGGCCCAAPAATPAPASPRVPTLHGPDGRPLPHSGRELPDVRELVPDLREALPDLRDRVPFGLGRFLPDVRHVVPDVRKRLPDPREWIPKAFDIPGVESLVRSATEPSGGADSGDGRSLGKMLTVAAAGVAAAGMELYNGYRNSGNPQSGAQSGGARGPGVGQPGGYFMTSPTVSVTLSTSPQAPAEWAKELRRGFTFPQAPPAPRAHSIPRDEDATILRGARTRQSNLLKDVSYERAHGGISDAKMGQLVDFADGLRRAIDSGEVSGSVASGFRQILMRLEQSVPVLKPLDESALQVVVGAVNIPQIRSSAGEIETRAVASRPPVGIRALQDVLGALESAYVKATRWTKGPSSAVGQWAGPRLNSVASETAEAARAGTRWAGNAAGSVYNYATQTPVVGGAFDSLKGLLSQDFSKSRVKENLAPAANQFVGLAASLGPLGMVATLLSGVFQGLAPVIDAVKEPLRIVGEIFGKALAPILKALFPVFKIVAIAATYIGEIFFRVTAGISKAVGSVIKALGTAIDKVPFLGDFGLKKLGQGIIDTGNAYSQGADALREGRETIQNLEFGETAQTVEQANEALRNVPEGFKVAVARFQAASPVAAAGGGLVPASAPVAPAEPPQTVENNPVTIQSVQIVSNDPERIWRELKPVMERENYRNGGTLLDAA